MQETPRGAQQHTPLCSPELYALGGPYRRLHGPFFCAGLTNVATLVLAQLGARQCPVQGLSATSG